MGDAIQTRSFRRFAVEVDGQFFVYPVWQTPPEVLVPEMEPELEPEPEPPESLWEAMMRRLGIGRDQ